MNWQRDRWLYPIFIRGDDLDRADQIQYFDDTVGMLNITLPESGFYYMGVNLPTGYNSLPQAFITAINDAITLAGGGNTLDMSYSLQQLQYGSITGFENIGECAVRLRSTAGETFRVRSMPSPLDTGFSRVNNLSLALGLPSVFGSPSTTGIGWVESTSTSPSGIGMPHSTFGIWHTPVPATDKRRMMERLPISSGGAVSFSLNWEQNNKRRIKYSNIHPVHVRSNPNRAHNVGTDTAYGGLAPFDAGNAFEDMWINSKKGGDILLYQDGGSGQAMSSLSYDVEIVNIAPEFTQSFDRCVTDRGYSEHYDIEFEINVKSYEVNY